MGDLLGAAVGPIPHIGSFTNGGSDGADESDVGPRRFAYSDSSRSGCSSALDGSCSGGRSRNYSPDPYSAPMALSRLSPQI